MIVGALVLPPTRLGITEASTTRRPSRPWTRSVGSTTDIPDLSFSLESFDASAELEATLCGQVFGGTNDTQTVTITGTPTGGTFTLSWGGQTTGNIAYNATSGAVQNRLSVTVSNLQSARENLTAANSRIRDTDIAQESSNLTRSQVLVQAGTAMLAQANAAPQAALQLLG